ncbi:hypothetical protein O0I10_006388 [Lichtheimia ornata]|uniref:Uncharacterized protein n=1 Tax=Lichtheimia ornata TaxID=688661 RepID=A0AAD7XX84_9FUNG|nr:uncharacterized protein O0I10_006388 [Lichtheimia ornata]KAJ8657860.1 hypothetical protein O0I10_006388 [Lichtheimia ornata]
MSSTTKRHVTIEEVEDSGDEQQLNRNQSSGQQQPSAFVYDACESAKQTYAPSDRNASWDQVEEAEARARIEREGADVESNQERKNAEQTAQMMDDYLQGQRR